MTNALASFVFLGLLSGCTTNLPPEYQVGSTPARQGKTSAERSHAEQTAALIVPEHDSPPQVVKSHFPDYPQNLRSMGIEGGVVVLFTVGSDGKVSNPVVAGAPPPELAAIVLNAITQWQFKPAIKNGQPVSVRAQQGFTFKVE